MSQSWMMSFSNGIIGLILRSPLHGMLGASTLLITVTGRKTGRSISTPVNFVQVEHQIIITSLPERTWWRNIVDGSPVTIVLKGKILQLPARVIREPSGVASQLTCYFSAAPSHAKFFNVAIGPDGKPDPGDLDRVSRERVVILVDLPN